MVLKNICFWERRVSEIIDEINIFKNIIEFLNCESLKILKLYTDYTPDLLNILIQNLFNLSNLEFLGVSLSKNDIAFKNSIKNLISIVQSKETKLSKFKIHKFTWDIDKFQGLNYLNFAGCKLNPADLMILEVLCEERIVKNAACVDLSDNIGIVDSSFIQSLVKIINTLGCSEIIMKNSGCKQEHVEKIIASLENIEGSEINFRIS